MFKERFGKMEPIKNKQGSLPTEKDKLRNLLKGWRELKKEAEKEKLEKYSKEEIEEKIKETKKRLEKTT